MGEGVSRLRRVASPIWLANRLSTTFRGAADLL